MDDEQFVERILSFVDSTTFGEGDWNMVVMESSSLAAHWAKLGSYLGLQSSYIDVIRGGNPLCPSSSWNETLSQWIKQNYSTRAHGLPSWRTLLRAISKVDKLLFQKLAVKHATPGLASRVKMEFERMSTMSCDTGADSTNSPEYETVIQCTSMLRTAVQDHLLTLSGHLLGRHLISPEQDSELRNEMHSETSRAARLIKMVQGRVKLSPKWYHMFIEVLEGEEDNFRDILKYLKDTYSSLTSGEANEAVIDRADKIPNPSGNVKEDFWTWLESKGISENDCKILKDNEINREAFRLLDEQDLKNLGLSYGAQKIIKSLLNSSAQVDS